MNNKAYPRILIIGQSFTTTSGGGITLINLFKGWNPDNLAVLTTDIDYQQELIARHYYQIGNNEEKWAFPFSLFQRNISSGPVRIEGKTTKSTPPNTTRPRSKGIKQWLKSTLYTVLKFLGIYHSVYKYELSPELVAWIKDFDPEIIYSQGTSLASIKLTHEIYDMHQAFGAIHIMDDYLSTMIKPGLRQGYWKKELDTQFRRLVDRAPLLMSICQEMSDEYEERYGRPFLPFHNPIDVQKWLRESREKWQNNTAFRIMYGGRIGPGTSDSVAEIAEAVDLLVKQGHNIHFEVFTYSQDERILGKIRSMRNCTTPPPLAHHEMPGKLASMDLLVLPIDFHEEGFRYIRLSMPTKASEYMASGSPILVYAPEKTALYKYAHRKGWAYTVSHNRIQDIADAILKLQQDPELRQHLGETGKKIAVDYHDAKIVREQFREALASRVVYH